MSTENADTLLQQGISAVKAKNRADARRYLSAAVKLNPQNEEGWLWLAGTMTDPLIQKDCLERVLAINPENKRAKIGLDYLQNKLTEKPLSPDPEIAPSLEAEKTELPDALAEPLAQLDDDSTLSRFFAKVGEAPPPALEFIGGVTPSADSGSPGKALGFQAKPKPAEVAITTPFKQEYEPFAVTANGAKLLARHQENGGFALYSTAPDYVSNSPNADKLTEHELVYYRAPVVLTDVTLEHFIDEVGGLPEPEAVDLLLHLCDRLLGYYNSSRADSWLRTGCHGPRDIKVTERGELEPYTGFTDAPLTDKILAFLPPEFGKPSQRDQRSDVYTLCSVLYYLLTGSQERLSAYRSRGKALLYEHYGQRFNPKLVKIIEKGLTIAPANRFQNVAALRLALLEVHKIFFPARKIWTLVAAGVAMLLVGALVFFLVSQNPPSPSPAQTSLTPEAATTTVPPTPAKTTPATVVAGDAAVSLAAPTLVPTPTPAIQADMGRLLLQQASFKDGQLTAYFGVLGRDNKPLSEVRSRDLRLFLNSSEVTNYKLDQIDPAADPLTLLVVLDTSDTMPLDYFNQVKNNLSQFVQGLNPKYQVGLVRYAERPELAAEISEDKSKLIDAVKSLQPQGANATFDALVFATEQLKSRTGRKAILLVTTGTDRLSPVTQPSLLAERLQEADSNLYVLGYHTSTQLTSGYKQLVELSGGYYNELTGTEQLTAGFVNLNILLNKTFKLSYNQNEGQDPNNAPPPKKQRLTLQLSLDDGLYLALKQFE